MNLLVRFSACTAGYKRLTVEHLVLSITFLLALGLGFFVVPPDVLKVDEGAHYGQIAAYIRGQFAPPQNSGLTMLPGYHAVVAAVAATIHLESIDAVRVISSLIALPALVVFF